MVQDDSTRLSQFCANSNPSCVILPPLSPHSDMLCAIKFLHMTSFLCIFISSLHIVTSSSSPRSVLQLSHISPPYSYLISRFHPSHLISIPFRPLEFHR